MTRRRRKPTRATTAKNRTGLAEQHHIICGALHRTIKADGANPSKAVRGIWACNVPLREHPAAAVRACNFPIREQQASAVRACNVLFREHQASAVRACNAPIRENQAFAVRACNVPVRNSRPRDHDASPDPRFLAPCPRRSLVKNRQKLLVTAPEATRPPAAL